MGRVVDPKRWENQWHFPPWLGVVLVVVVALLFALASNLQRAFLVP